MLLTITTTHQPATDLGFLLHKHPERLHSRPLAYGVGHVFYAEAQAERCTAVLCVEIDPVALVRGRKGSGATVGLTDQYVNDRPYVASSLLCSAIARMLGSALGGRSAERPELAQAALPLQFGLPTLPCRGGEALLRALFEPLGFVVHVSSAPPAQQPSPWGAGPYLDVQLQITAPLATALRQLCVLIPVLDDRQHFWVDYAEVATLLGRSHDWLPAHPKREFIAARYLKHTKSLTRSALGQLEAADAEPRAASGAMAASPSGSVRLTGTDRAERAAPTLQAQRLAAVVDVVLELGAGRVIDLGCGDGRLLHALLPRSEVAQLAGVDVSLHSLSAARERLRVAELPPRLAGKLQLFQGALTYRDARLAGYDVATVIEVIEHLDAERLPALAHVLFGAARPKAVVMTTPNAAYNPRYAGLAAGALRHHDHRFEWTCAQFESWCQAQAESFGYTVRFRPIGEADAALGAPTQMAVFTRSDGA